MVLNPAFVGRHTYHQLKAQDYEVFRNDVWDARLQGEPMLLYAIELYFWRDPIASSAAAERCVQDIVQDADKLVGARLPAYEGFVEKTQHMAFLKGPGDDRRSEIEEAMKGRCDVKTVFAP